MPTKSTKKNSKPEKDSVRQEPKQKAEAKVNVTRLHPRMRLLKKLSSREI